MATTALTKSEALVAEARNKARKITRALRESGAPERLFLGNVIGGTAGTGLIQLGDWALNKALALKPGEAPGLLKKYPEVTKGVAIGVVGMAVNAVNLAVEYDFPMSLERDAIDRASSGMVMVAVDRIIRALPKLPPPAQAPTA